MCEHKNSEKLFGLTNEKGEKVVLTICKDCMSILNYSVSKEEKVKVKENQYSYSIEQVYETFRKLRTVSDKVSINDVMSGLGLKKTQKNEFIEFINAYKDYFYIENNKIITISLTPWEIEGTNAYIEKIRKENSNKFIMKININSGYGSEQTYSIYLSKLYYDLAIINELTMDKVVDIFKEDFEEYGTFQSKQKAPYKKNAYRPSEGKLYKYSINPITKEQLPQIVKTMKEKAKEKGIDLLFTISEFKLNEYK